MRLKIKRKRGFYFVGFNPAADGTNRPLSSPELHNKEWSAYTQQCWEYKGKCTPNTKDCSKTGKDEHQRNVQWIMSQYVSTWTHGRENLCDKFDF
jgi:hypothetical protein